MSKSPKDTHGPVVKSGPTAGKNRARTTAGNWRKKRDDAGKSRKSKGSSGKKGCFITTAACEFMMLPDDCVQLRTLRSFRDSYLEETPEGRKLVEEYYRVAPGLVPLVKNEDIAAVVWRAVTATVELIEKRQSEEAVEEYQKLVVWLQSRQP